MTEKSVRCREHNYFWRVCRRRLCRPAPPVSALAEPLRAGHSAVGEPHCAVGRHHQRGELPEVSSAGVTGRLFLYRVSIDHGHDQSRGSEILTGLKIVFTARQKGQSFFQKMTKKTGYGGLCNCGNAVWFVWKIWPVTKPWLWSWPVETLLVHHL